MITQNEANKYDDNDMINYLKKGNPAIILERKGNSIYLYSNLESHDPVFIYDSDLSTTLSIMEMNQLIKNITPVILGGSNEIN